MPFGAAISAVGSIAGAGIGAWASGKASSQQAAMLQKALDLQKQYMGPYVQAGQDILPILKSLITPGANMTDTLSKIPGFTFAQDWGQKAVKNLGTTMGLGGNVVTAGADYATGKAMGAYGGIVNALQNYASMGANAAAGAGSMTGNTLGAIGGANAAGTLGSANALATGIQGIGNTALNYRLLSSLKAGGAGGGVYGGGGNVGQFPTYDSNGMQIYGPGF